MNVPGRWLRKSTIWRKLSLNTWATPDNPTIYGVLEIDAGRLQEWLARASAASGTKCTLTHAVTRALAITMRRFPESNVLVRGRRIWLRRDVDVFHQVAIPVPGTKGGADLSGAVVRQADTKRVPRIAAELAAGAQAVREKRDGEMARTRGLLMALPDWLARWAIRVLGWLGYGLNLEVPTSPRDPFGGAMVTSVGMLGIQMAFAPLVTFSRVPLLLVVNAIDERPVARDGEVVIRPILPITATIDHRVMDGFQAASLAREMTALLENPERLDEDACAPA